MSWWSHQLGFRRNYAQGLPPLTEDDDPSRFLDKLDEYNAPVIQKWKAVQSLILRGLCGGLLASLTLVGSQLFTGPLKTSVAYLTAFFLCGLGIQTARMIIEGFAALEGFLGLSTPVLSRKQGFIPGRGWTTLPILFDAVSLIILIFAINYGMNLLFSLTES